VAWEAAEYIYSARTESVNVLLYTFMAHSICMVTQFAGRSQMVPRSVRCYSQDKLMCNSNDTGNLVPQGSYSVIRYLWGSDVFPPPTPMKLTANWRELYSDGVTRVQHVTKWCTKSQNDQTDIYDGDVSAMLSSAHQERDTNAAWSAETDFATKRLTIRYLFTTFQNNEEVELAIHKLSCT
jgi:hypothetical protein